MLSISYMHQFLTSMTFTLVVETLVLLAILKYATKHPHLSKRRITFAGVFASFATIPYVWFVFPYLFAWTRATSLNYSEPFVAIVEAIFYRVFLKTSWKVSFAASLVCNIASYLLGPALRAHGLWIYW